MKPPYVTAEVPGCGGRFKASPEDFEVEELPAYAPDGGDGEHLFLWVEKRGRTTPEAARLFAEAVGANPSLVSWAGLKDREAVTRQWLCLPFREVKKPLDGLELPGVKVLSHARHRNKLKAGHLHGNRFTLVLREVKDTAAAKASFERLVTSGVPNFYGEQRFGAHKDNAAKGKALLLGQKKAPRFERKLWLSAFQSELFNEVLAARVNDGSWCRALLGDVLKRHPLGGEFLCEDLAVEQPRVEAFEVSPSGPMFGPEMRAPSGDARALEARVLEAAQVKAEDFVNGGSETKGTRRWLRVPMGAPSFEAAGEDVRLRFELPSGSYATVILRELLKG